MAGVEILIVVGMVLLNSLFAAFELALASVSLGRLKLLTDQKRIGAAQALAMKNRMEASLAVVQIGVTLTGATAAATCGAGANEGISPWLQASKGVSPGLADALAIAMVVLPLSAATIIIGELVPKSLALRNSEWVCLKLSPLMRGFAMVVYPAMLLLEWVTRRLVHVFERNVTTGGGGQYEIGLAELRAQTQTLRTSRIIGAEQERIILGASTLARVKVADILVPMGDVVMLDANGSLGDHLVVAHFDGYTRFPVTQRAGDPQAVIGYVNIKDLLVLTKTSTEEVSIRSIVRPMVAVSLGHVHRAGVQPDDEGARPPDAGEGRGGGGAGHDHAGGHPGGDRGRHPGRVRPLPAEHHAGRESLGGGRRGEPGPDAHGSQSSRPRRGQAPGDDHCGLAPGPLRPAPQGRGHADRRRSERTHPQDAPAEGAGGAGDGGSGGALIALSVLQVAAPEVRMLA